MMIKKMMFQSVNKTNVKSSGGVGGAAALP